MNSNSHVTESMTLSAQNPTARRGGVSPSSSSLHLEHFQKVRDIDNFLLSRSAP